MVFAHRHNIIRILFVFLFYAFILVLPGCGNDNDQPSVFLSFNYSPGEVYLYEMFDDVEYETKNCDGEVTRVTHNQKQMTKIKVQEPDTANIFYNLLVSFVVVADTVIYPSNYNEEKKQHGKELIGRVTKYNLAMRQNGEIVSVDGRNESATEYYERAYKTRQPVFPQKPIKPGYKWKHTIYLTIPDNEPIPVVIKYKFSGYEKIDEYDCAVIEYFSTFKKSSDLTATKWNKQNNFKQWLAEYTTKSSGKLYFAYSHGIVAKTEATINMETEYDIVEQDGSPTKFVRKTVDKELLNLVSVKRDSTILTNQSIYY